MYTVLGMSFVLLVQRLIVQGPSPLGGARAGPEISSP
jgi:hypothetical protein